MVLGNTHTEQLVATVVLVQHVVGVLPQFLHVRPDQHLPELDKVAVLLVVDLDDTPRIRTSTDDATIFKLELGVGANNSEGDLGDDGFVLSKSLLIFVLVDGGLEDTDVVVLNISQNLMKSTGEHVLRMKQWLCSRVA